MSAPEVTASFIVHGDGSRIAAALDSLATASAAPVVAYLTRNTPVTPPFPSDAYPTVRVIDNAKPQGFAANHNRILALAETPYVALCNDDILIAPGALDVLVAYLDAHPGVGVAAPQLVNGDGTPQVSVYSDPSLARMLYKISGLATLTHQESALRRLFVRLGAARLVGVESLVAHAEARAVPVVKGAFMLVRRVAYAQVGGMDETTRGYGEEIDWHWRMRQAGWQVAIVPAARVTHFGQGQVRLRLSGDALVQDRLGILNYFRKHRPRWQSALIRLALLVCHGLYALAWLPFSRRRSGAHARAAALAWGRAIGEKQKT